jgi:3-phosphoshikimate 1-carboxyvinyltransferase
LLLTYTEIEIKELEINLPASKSISNRALIIQAMADDRIQLSNLSEAEDTQILSAALRQRSLKKNAGMAGTAARFLSAFLATQQINYFLDGDPRMRKRPMKQLLDTLVELGASITYLDKAGHLPIQINGALTEGGQIQIDASESSQFITALMLIGPKLKGGLTIELIGSISSAPYIQMTKSIMEYFQVPITFEHQIIQILEQGYQAAELTIESEWSSASYFYSSLALLDEGSLVLKNLSFNSWQGDEITADIYYRLGIKSTKIGDDILIEKVAHAVEYLEYDFVDCPDLAQSVICTCIGLGIEGEFTGLHTLKGKETDRIKAVQNEIKKLNWTLEETAEGNYHLSRAKERQAIQLQIETYNDHRMAMAFAPLTIIYEELQIESPDVVKKSFPLFWNELQKMGIS